MCTIQPKEIIIEPNSSGSSPHIREEWGREKDCDLLKRRRSLLEMAVVAARQEGVWGATVVHGLIAASEDGE